MTRPDERPDRGQRETRGSRGTRGGGHARATAPRPGADRHSADRKPRRVEPPLPEDVTGRELDRSVRDELGSLARINADIVARHLVMAGRLVDEDPELAYEHARAAQARAGRVGAVREAAGLAAYATGRFAEALSELRAARRISGDDSLLPVLADCERGLGRPERALALAASPELAGLDAGVRVEMLIVASGARRDLGQHEAAVQALHGPQLKPPHGGPGRRGSSMRTPTRCSAPAASTRRSSGSVTPPTRTTSGRRTRASGSPTCRASRSPTT